MSHRPSRTQPCVQSCKHTLSYVDSVWSSCVQLLPLMAGLHEVKGLIIMDMVTSQEYEQGRLCEVLVVRKPPLSATATPSN